MSLTDSLVTFCDAVKSLLETNQVDLGLQDVFYGDQEKIPRSPAAAVEPLNESSELAGVPRRVALQFNCYVIIYNMRLDDVQNIRRDTDLLAQAVKNLIHQDSTFGGIVIHSMVANTESGYTFRGGTLWRTARLTVQADSKVNLPMNPGV